MVSLRHSTGPGGNYRESVLPAASRRRFHEGDLGAVFVGIDHTACGRGLSLNERHGAPGDVISRLSMRFDAEPAEIIPRRSE
jgi:hypothetical protein